jgi:histidinol-phosphatase
MGQERAAPGGGAADADATPRRQPDEAGSAIAETHAVPADHGPAWSASWARLPESELEYRLAFALDCCDEADRISLGQFRRDIAVMTKPDRSFVTAADQGIERMIRERIGAAFPTDGLVGEEYGEEAGAASIRWYIDPIDGTHNFIRGIPVFGTLIALEADGEIQLGVMSAPALRERWHARRGGGAWALGMSGGAPRSIRASRIERIEDAQILYGSGSEIAASGAMPGFSDLLAGAWRERGYGDFWGYALLAEGAAEAMIEVDLHVWDIAAPAVIIEEAGGRLTDIDGQRRLDASTTVATNGALHEPILRRLAGR